MLLREGRPRGQEEVGWDCFARQMLACICCSRLPCQPFKLLVEPGHASMPCCAWPVPNPTPDAPHLNVSSLPCLTSNAFHSSQNALSARGSAREAPCT